MNVGRWQHLCPVGLTHGVDAMDLSLIEDLPEHAELVVLRRERVGPVVVRVLVLECVPSDDAVTPAVQLEQEGLIPGPQFAPPLITSDGRTVWVDGKRFMFPRAG